MLPCWTLCSVLYAHVSLIEKVDACRFCPGSPSAPGRCTLLPPTPPTHPHTLPLSTLPPCAAVLLSPTPHRLKVLLPARGGPPPPPIVRLFVRECASLMEVQHE